MRGRIRAGAFGVGCAGLLVLSMVSPAAGLREDGPPSPCNNPCGDQAPNQMGRGDVTGDCEDAAMNTPPSSGDVHLSADVPDGAQVGPGEDILLRLTWDKTRFSGPELDRALDCIRLKGSLDPDMSASEQPTDNDGVYEYRLHVPEDIKPGCDVCAQGFVAGDAAGNGGGPLQLRSERHCFMSGPPEPPRPPATRPPAPPATRPPAPPATRPPTTPVTQPTPPATTAIPPRASAEVPPPALPTEVGGITASQPGANPAGAPARPPAAELPRTGATSRGGTAAGGLALALGGFAVIGGSGQRKRRRSGV